MKFLSMVMLALAPCAQAQVRLAYPADTLKGRIRQMTEHRFHAFYSIKAVYCFDSVNRQELAMFYDESDSLQASWVVQYDECGRISSKALSPRSEPACATISYNYDQHDRKTGERNIASSRCFALFDWLKGRMSSWMIVDLSIITRRYEYGFSDRLQREFSEDESVDGSDTFKITTTTRYGYVPAGGNVAIIETELSRLGGKIKDTMFESVGYEYDRVGNTIRVIKQERDFGKTAVDSVVRLMRYDARNKLVESKSYFKSERSHPKAGLGELVGGGSEYFYDSLGTQTSDNSYDLYRRPDGSETKDVTDTWKRNPDHEERPEFDQMGNVVKIRRGAEIILSREIEYE